MRSSSGNSRIFNAHDGWYVVMRASDNRHLAGSKYKMVGDQHIMGPFPDKDRLINWFEGFLAMYSEDRKDDDFFLNNFETHH